MSQCEMPLGTIHGRGCGVQRAADAMLRTLGAGTITLRISDPSTGDTNSQLGITPPTSEDVQISPALVRTIAPATDGSPRFEVLLSSKAVKPIAESYGIQDVGTWLVSAQGVLYHDNLMHIDAVICDRYAGTEYLYHIMVTE